MKISLDMQADALYIEFQKGKFSRNKKIDEDTIIDFDDKGRILGIELLDVTKRIPIDQLSSVDIRMPIKAHT